MNNIKFKKNKDVYLKIKSKRGKGNLTDGKKSVKIKQSAKEKEPEIQTVQEYLDIALSCDNMFQYIFENKFLNRRYYWILLILTFQTLIMNYLSGFVMLALFRSPEYAYKYECFLMKNNAFQNCTFRDLCYCKSDVNCVNVCYDTRAACRKKFINSFNHKSIDIVNSNRLTRELYVRFIDEDSKITLFSKIDDFCLMKKYFFLLVIFLFIGGSVGLALSGIFSDRYGKRKVIIWISISICIQNAIVISLSTYTVGNFSSLSVFFVIWGFISFFSGFSLFALEYLVFLNFMEFYPDSKSLKKINSIFHSQFTFTNLGFIALNSYIKNLFIFYYVSLAFFFGFTIIFSFYFIENPRYYSERRDYDMKMKSFSKIIQKILVIKEDHISFKTEHKHEFSKHGMYWKELVITNIIKKKQAEKLGEEGIPDEVRALIPMNTRNKRQYFISDTKNQEKIESDCNTVRSSKNLNSKKTSIKRNLSGRKGIVLQENNETLFDGYNNEDLLNKTKRRNILNLFKIYRKFFGDKFVKKYFLSFLLLWFSIIYCFYGSTFSLLFILANPNKSSLIDNYGVVIYCFLVLLLMPYIIGNLSGIIPLDNKYFVMLTFLIYTLISVFLDSHNLMPDSDKILYFNSQADYQKFKISSISVSTCSSLVITSVSLFNLLLITSVPTAYRTIFVSSIKSMANLIPIICYLSFTMIDTPFLILGIIAFCGFFIFFWLQFKWRDIKLVESVDKEDVDIKINNKINSRLKRQNPSKSSKVISNNRSLSNRLSIFNRVKQYSFKSKL